ncbi:MAG: hypothetical protein KKE11_01290 [Gammaproteobacteria bacterium]|nr:hypothetical protein [Gammaproteobacteria bacterium]
MRGFYLRGQEERDFVIADSYFNNGHYEQALQGFKNIGYQPGIELAEWAINNRSIKSGRIQIVEHIGPIPAYNTEITSIDSRQYCFISFHKGPVYRYDKVTDKHAVIYYPESKYDWCDQLSFDGRFLTIQLRDGAGVFRFDNMSGEISPVKA